MLWAHLDSPSSSALSQTCLSSLYDGPVGSQMVYIPLFCLLECSAPAACFLLGAAVEPSSRLRAFIGHPGDARRLGERRRTGAAALDTFRLPCRRALLLCRRVPGGFPPHDRPLRLEVPDPRLEGRCLRVEVLPRAARCDTDKLKFVRVVLATLLSERSPGEDRSLMTLPLRLAGRRRPARDVRPRCGSTRHER